MWKEPSKKQVSPLVKAARKAQKAVGQALFMLFALVYGLWLSAYNWFMMLTFRPRALVYDGTRPAEKEYAFSDKISVTDIKLCQKAFKSKGRKITLNDVMSAVVAKSMTTYFAEAGEHVDRRRVESRPCTHRDTHALASKLGSLSLSHSPSVCHG
jgi:hypothetical protein